MSISCQQLKRLVSNNHSDLHRIKTLLKMATCALVSEIVEMKAGDPRLLTGLGEVLGDRIQVNTPDLPINSPGVQAFFEDGQGNRREL